MRIVIFSDTHLGRKNFKVAERENDFFSAFKQVIDYAIDNNSEAVLHAGDLFDTAKPAINVIIFAVEQLKRLKERGIPFFCISGSHDISATDSFLNVLQSVGLLANLTSKKYYEAKEDRVILKGESFNGLFIAGIPGKSNISSEIEYLQPDIPKSHFSIFMFHHIIEDISPVFSSIKKSMLPKGFDLYISGHWHEKFSTSIGDAQLLYPGSTENCDLNEMRSEFKGFIDYDTSSKNYEFVKLNIRKVIINEIDCTGLNPLAATDKMIGLIKPSNKEMVFFILKGRLREGIKSEINRQAINEAAMKNNYLLSRVYLNQLEDAFCEQIISGKKTIEEIEFEFFKSRGFKDGEISAAINIINLAVNEDESKGIIELLKGEDFLK
jgi:DNA repair exonuclease SbcCD nuclease subunit